MAKERPQARVIAGKGRKPFAQFYTPAKTKAYEQHVAVTARAQMLAVDVDGPDFTLPVRNVRILANIRFNLKKPPSYPKSVVHAVKKPDLDNLVKAILDGLVIGVEGSSANLPGIIEDDNCITDVMMRKRYVEPGHPVGVEIELTCLSL